MGDNESDLRRFVRHLLQKSKLSGPIIPDQNVINVATEPNDFIQPRQVATKSFSRCAGNSVLRPRRLGGAATAVSIST